MARSSLSFDSEKITWRIRSDDLAYLRAVFDRNQVNAVVRDLIHLYVERMKAKAAAGVHPRTKLAELYAEDVTARMEAGE